MRRRRGGGADVRPGGEGESEHSIFLQEEEDRKSEFEGERRLVAKERLRVAEERGVENRRLRTLCKIMEREKSRLHEARSMARDTEKRKAEEQMRKLEEEKATLEAEERYMMREAEGRRASDAACEPLGGRPSGRRPRWRPRWRRAAPRRNTSRRTCGYGR